MSPYLRICKEDFGCALKLYIWNTNISAALYSPLQGVEITLRNALCRELKQAYGAAWYDNPTCRIDRRNRQGIECAKQALARWHKPITPPRMVAELTFGFWVSLFNRHHEELWRAVLHKAFTSKRKLRRKDVSQQLAPLKELRNRIAHHEPVFQRRLEEDYERALTLIDWICPETAAWIAHHCDFQEILQKRPL